MFKKILDKMFPKYNDDKRTKPYNESSEKGFLLFKRQSIRRATGEKYLERLILIRCMFGAIMFHRIYATDTDCMHDHPWSFHTILIKGHYKEYFARTEPNGNIFYSSQIVKPWKLQYRPENCTHRLEIPAGVKSVWSIVFTSPKKKSWGFLTPRGWENWRLHPMSNTCE